MTADTKTDIEIIPELLEQIALEWEADIRFNKMSDGSEPGQDVKIMPREFGARATVERRIDLVRDAATEIETLREACHQALGSLKALGAEKGSASQILRHALGLEDDHV